MFYYTPNQQLTFNRIFNFIVGVRGGGKTFNTVKFGIDKFKKTGQQFVYLRRRGVDLEDACTGGVTNDLFADIRKQGFFKDDELKITADKTGGYIFYCNEKVMGYGKALSTSRRSASLPEVNLIIFDEFLIDGRTGAGLGYLNKGEEFFVFNNFYETIARGRDIPVVFIGNAFSMVNPYFIELGIRISDPINNKIYKGKGWTLQFWRGEEYIESREQTQHYQLTKGTKYSDHAFGNDFYVDKKDFISKRSKKSEHQFSIVYLGTTYGVWVDWDKGLYYISTKGASASRDKTISLSMADNKPNNINIRRYRNMPFIKVFRAAVDQNAVYYDSQSSYNMVSEAVYLLKTIT